MDPTPFPSACQKRKIWDIMGCYETRTVGLGYAPTGQAQLSTGQLHFDGFDSLLLCQKEKAPLRGALFLKRDTGVDCHSPLGNVWRPARPAGQAQLSTGQLHFDGFDALLLCQKEKAPLRGAFSFWSRIRESNPPSRLGKPLYYRYTNPACVRIIADPLEKFNCFLSKVSVPDFWGAGGPAPLDHSPSYIFCLTTLASLAINSPLVGFPLSARTMLPK